jgi:hypothetical protein
MIQLDESAAASAADLATSKLVAERLHQKYPGHLWGVHCQAEQGILTIRNFGLSAKYGYVVHLKPIFSDSELMRLADLAGGEILERYRLTRGAFRGDEYDAIPAGLGGQLVGDLK